MLCLLVPFLLARTMPIKKGCSLLLLLPLLLPSLPGGRLNGRNPRLLAPEAERFNDRRTHRPHRSPARAPEGRPILHEANSKPLGDSRGEATTGALSSTSRIASRSAKGFAHCKLPGPGQAYENRNLLPAELLLRLLLSGRLAGRSWLPALL